jgi:hypothetical protein
MKLRSSRSYSLEPFPFLQLPLELRYLIYRQYAAVIPQAPVRRVATGVTKPPTDPKWSSFTKRISEPPALLFVNKQVHNEFQEEVKQLPHSLCIVHFDESTQPEQVITSAYGLPTNQKFHVDKIDFKFTPTRSNDRFSVAASEPRIKTQLRCLGAFLDLCDGVTKIQCQVEVPGSDERLRRMVVDYLRQQSLDRPRSGIANLQLVDRTSYTWTIDFVVIDPTKLGVQNRGT